MRRKVGTGIETKGSQVKGEQTTPLLKLGRKIKSLDDAKRLMSSLISRFCRGQITDRDSKTLTYLIISFVSIAKDSELEERLRIIERQMELKK